MNTEAATLPETLRDKALNSLFFTAQAFLGFDKLSPTLHYEMCQVMEAADRYKRLLVLVPRDHYKSTICTISYPVWTALRNPNECMLIVANSATNAQKFGHKIRSSFERKALLRQFFPHLKPELSNRWNADELCLPRDTDDTQATWTFAGWTSKVTSQHVDRIIFDDLVDEETYESPDLMVKLIDRFEQKEGLLRPPVTEKPIIVVMNHWSSIDLACHIIEKHPEYHVYYRQAIESGKPIFPEMYKLDWLLRKQEINPYNFATQWMNDPADRSVVENKPEHLQKYMRKSDHVLIKDEFGDEVKVPIRSMNLYATVDPRHALSTKSWQKLTSKNVIMVGGIDPQGRRFALDEYSDQKGPEVLVAKMYEMWEKWEPLGLIKMGIESYGYQKALEPLAKLIWREKPLTPNLMLLPTDTVNSKETRIRGGFRVFAEGKGYTHTSLVGFNSEYYLFPMGKFRDHGDCWAWLQHLMNVPFDDAAHKEEEELDKAYLASLASMGRI